MADENAVALEKPEAFKVPDISKPLIDVFKTGGMPLAFLFILAAIIGWILTQQFADQALSTILTILKWMLAGSFMSFAVLSVLGYLKWREEIGARLAEHRLNMDEYRDRYRIETTLQEKLIVTISSQATAMVSAHSDWSPEGVVKATEALTKSVETLLPKMMEMRAKMQQQSTPLPTTTNSPQ